ncbi:MAG: MmcQ/YjbR family DNA-binding protein [Acidimicrobiia bacterium]
MSLPGTSEEPHFDKTSFRVRGRIYATWSDANHLLAIQVDEAEARSLLTQDPSVFTPALFGKTRVVADWIGVRPVSAEPDLVFELLENAWRRRASKRAVAAFDHAAAP